MRFVAALASVLVLLVLVEMALRIGYPCDLMMWSESPFMTNMMKLVHGMPIYTTPSDLNSYIYSPGLEYLTYTVLGPLGLALDVRFCRAVNVLVGLAAALIAGVLIVRVESDVHGGRRSWTLFLVSACTAALIVFNSQTSDGLHPDNLHMLHAVLSCLLCYEALRSGSVALAAATIAIAGVGVAVKQPAALAPVGAAAALLLGRRWERRGTLVLVAALTGVAVFMIWFVLGDANRRFFILDVPTSQPILYARALGLLDLFFRGHRLLLFVAVPFAVATILRAAPEPGRRFLLAWGALGLAEVAPSGLAALKVLGVDNNFAVMALWLWLLTGPAIGHVLTRWRPAGAGDPVPLLATGLLVVVLLSLLPMKVPPPSDSYRYCDAILTAVGADLKAGRRVFLSAGTTPFIRDGSSAVLLDRNESLAEVWWAGKKDVLDAMMRRFADGDYDRLYFVGGWAVPTIKLPVERYVKVGEIPGAAAPWLAPFLLPYWSGMRFTFETHSVNIYRLKDGA
jgi:Dolichyl-phosphate-mannose-protein mannosyltransferase